MNEENEYEGGCERLERNVERVERLILLDQNLSNPPRTLTLIGFGAHHLISPIRKYPISFLHVSHHPLTDFLSIPHL